MNDSQIARALTRLNVLALDRNITANGTTNSAAIDLKDYVGSLVLEFSAVSLGSGSSPTLDVAVRHGTTTSSMSEVSGGAFAQVTTARAQETIYLDTRTLNRYIDVAYTIGGSGAVTYAAAIIAEAVKQVGS